MYPRLLFFTVISIFLLNAMEENVDDWHKKVPIYLRQLINQNDKPKSISVLIQQLESEWQNNINAMNTANATLYLLPREIIQRILQYINHDNVFIAELLKQLKQSQNVILTQFHAMAGLRSAAIHNDKIITGGMYVDNVIEIRNRLSSELVGSLCHHSNCARTMTLHKDTLFSGDDSGMIKIWHLPSDKTFPEAENKCIKTLNNAHDSFIKGIAVKDTTMASVSFDKKVKIWDLENYKCLHTLSEHKDVIHGVAFMNYNIISAGDDGIRVWNLFGECLYSFPNVSWGVAVIDDNTFISAGYEGITIYHLKNSAKIETIKTSPGSVKSVAFIPNNLIATGSCDGTLSFYEFPSLKIITTLAAHENSIFSMTVEGNILTTISLDDHVKTWDVSALKELANINSFLRNKTSYLQGLLLYVIAKKMINKETMILNDHEKATLKNLKKKLTRDFGPQPSVLLQEIIQRQDKDNEKRED